jgi:hypothetical protein
VPFWVNEDSDADANEADFNQADIIAACQAAYQAWEDVPFAIITFRYQGETSARLGADAINTTLWYNAAFDRGECAGALGAAGGTVAITVLTENEQSGQIIDADVIMDSVDSWEINLACVEFDMQSVLTHEYGHSIGIHHSELPAGAMATRPTMNAFVFCDAGIGSGRTLEPDDEAAAQCLYPELPTVVLMDQTGSMCIGNRMPDAKAAANDFISSYSSNVMAVAGFAEGNTAECGGCAPRPGYELLQDWTVDAGALQAAINGTFACGFTPLWESVCCAIDKADENGPSNLLIFTDTGENSSNGTCGCTEHRSPGGRRHGVCHRHDELLRSGAWAERGGADRRPQRAARRRRSEREPAESLRADAGPLCRGDFAEPDGPGGGHDQSPHESQRNG